MKYFTEQLNFPNKETKQHQFFHMKTKGNIY